MERRNFIKVGAGALAATSIPFAWVFPQQLTWCEPLGRFVTDEEVKDYLMALMRKEFSLPPYKAQEHWDRKRMEAEMRAQRELRMNGETVLPDGTQMFRIPKEQ